MDRLLTMDPAQFAERMQADMREVLAQVAAAVNDAPSGNVINASEVRVRDLMAAFRRRAMETAVQMRIDSTESSFSPSAGRGGPPQAEQGAGVAQHAVRQRTDRPQPDPLARRGRGQ